MISVPNSFPHHKRLETQSRLKLSSLRQLDILGALLFLGLSVCLVAALQVSNVNFAWNSGVVIALLVISGTSLIGFTLWERLLMIYDKGIIPVLSWAFATRRALGLFMYVGSIFPDGMHAYLFIQGFFSDRCAVHLCGYSNTTTISDREWIGSFWSRHSTLSFHRDGTSGCSHRSCAIEEIHGEADVCLAWWDSSSARRGNLFCNPAIFHRHSTFPIWLPSLIWYRFGGK